MFARNSCQKKEAQPTVWSKLRPVCAWGDSRSPEADCFLL